MQTTFGHIEAHALREPQRLAMRDGPNAWTYSQLLDALLRLTRVLDGMGIRRGHRVAVSQPSASFQLMLLIACENVGAVSIPFMGQGDPERDVVLAMADWVFSERPQPCPAGVRFQAVDPAFLERVRQIDPFDGAACPRVSLDLAEPQRMSRTSGSTGRSRFMVMTRQAQEWWLRVVVEDPRCDPRARVLVGSSLVVNTAFVRASGTLRGGGAVLFTPAGEAVAIGMTDFAGLPAHLAQFLDQLPDGFVAPRPVRLHTAGGFLPDDLRQRALRMLGGPLVSRYGANEVGPVTVELDADGIGTIRDGVDVRIVDGAGVEVADGALGTIEARSPAIVDGYADAPEATSAAFHDGWFRSGDLGQIVGPRRLKVLGRHDDLVNIGGVKYPATQIETAVRGVAGVRDAAVLAINLHQGAITVGIAVELDAATRQEEAERRIVEALPLDAGTRAQLLYLPRLPRTAVGKVDRAAIHRMLQAAIQ